MPFNANDSRAAIPSLMVNAVEQPQGIRAYHGSPQRIEGQFSGSDMLSKAAEPHQLRFWEFRDKSMRSVRLWKASGASSKWPELHGLDTPFEWVERPKICAQPAPYEADIDLRTLKTKQPSISGHKVKSMVDGGVQPRTPTGTIYDGSELLRVRRTEDGGYVLTDGNDRMSAEAVKRNDIAKALVYANPSEASLPSLLEFGMQADQEQVDGGATLTPHALLGAPVPDPLNEYLEKEYDRIFQERPARANSSGLPSTARNFRLAG